MDGKKKEETELVWKISKILDKILSWTREVQQLARPHAENEETRLDGKKDKKDKNKIGKLSFVIP